MAELDSIQQWIDAEAIRFRTIWEQPRSLNMAVLRFHAITESMLDRVISTYLKRGNQFIEGQSLTYAEKLALVDSFGVTDERDRALLVGFNRLRNKCAHDITYAITTEDLERLASGLESAPNKPTAAAENYREALFGYLMPRVAGKLLKVLILPPPHRESDELSAFVQDQLRLSLDAFITPPGLQLEILKFHLVSEGLLDRIIRGRLNGTDRFVDEGRFRYAQKLLLVEALRCVDDSAIQVLRRLDRLRNQCAHNPNFPVTGKALRALAGPFAREAEEAKAFHPASYRERLFLAWVITRVLAKLSAAVWRVETPPPCQKSTRS